jgi:hypothetical protein
MLQGFSWLILEPATRLLMAYSGTSCKASHGLFWNQLQGFSWLILEPATRLLMAYSGTSVYNLVLANQIGCIVQL